MDWKLAYRIPLPSLGESRQKHEKNVISARLRDMEFIRCQRFFCPINRVRRGRMRSTNRKDGFGSRECGRASGRTNPATAGAVE